MKVLHTADVHLKEVEDERWNALIHLVDISKKEDVDYFIISGDLFDNCGIDFWFDNLIFYEVKGKMSVGLSLLSSVFFCFSK